MPNHEIDTDPVAPGPRLRGLTALLAPALTVMLLLAGCAGGTRDDATSKHSGAAKFKPIEKETYADIVAAVTACRNGVDKATWLSRQDKEVLHTTCNKGLRRGLTEVREYGLEACSEVSYTAPAKSEAEKARVLEECYAETKRKTTTHFPTR